MSRNRSSTISLSHRHARAVYGGRMCTHPKTMSSPSGLSSKGARCARSSTHRSARRCSTRVSLISEARGPPSCVRRNASTEQGAGAASCMIAVTACAGITHARKDVSPSMASAEGCSSTRCCDSGSTVYMRPRWLLPSTRRTSAHRGVEEAADIGENLRGPARRRGGQDAVTCLVHTLPQTTTCAIMCPVDLLLRCHC